MGLQLYHRDIREHTRELYQEKSTGLSFQTISKQESCVDNQTTWLLGRIVLLADDSTPQFLDQLMSSKCKWVNRSFLKQTLGACRWLSYIGIYESWTNGQTNSGPMVTVFTKVLAFCCIPIFCISCHPVSTSGMGFPSQTRWIYSWTFATILRPLLVVKLKNLWLNSPKAGKKQCTLVFSGNWGPQNLMVSHRFSYENSRVGVYNHFHGTQLDSTKGCLVPCAEFQKLLQILTI